jgi:DNA repair protein RAD50
LERLKDLQEKHSLSQSRLQKIELRKQELNAEVSKSKELLRNQDQLKRNIDDNLNYRKTKSEVDQLAHEIESLEEKSISFGTMSGIEADLKRLFQEKDRLLSEVLILYLIFIFRSFNTVVVCSLLFSLVFIVSCLT